MKKQLLKTMLVATGLLTSTLGTWADGTITATLVHTAGTAYGAAAAAGTANTVDGSAEYFNNDRTNTVYWAGWAFAEFSYEIPDGEKIKSATLTWKIKNAKTYASSLYYLNTGTTIDYNTILATKVAYQFGTSRTLIETTTNNPAGDVSYTTDVTDAVTKTTSQKFIVFQFTGNSGSATLYGKASDYAPTLTITTASASAMTTYNVKYTDEQGNEIKTSKSYDVAIGDNATAGSEDMASIFNDSKKYIYKSGNTTITAAEDATQNVITLVFREAETWNYSINCIAGNTTKQIKGSALEGESFNVAYPYALNANGTVYTTGKHSKDGKGYYLDFTLTENNKTQDITYSATDTKNVVYFSEAENIEGLTVITSGNTAIRSSNGSSAYAKDGNVEIIKLPAGAYKLHACFYDATKDRGTIWNFLAGDKNIFTFTTSAPNWDEGDSELFTINEDTPIYLAQGGSSVKAVDFLYIQKVADVATISDAEYATYVTTSAVKVPENVKVYTVTANETGVETKEVAAGTVLAAGTPVLLNAAAADYTFELSDEAGTKPADNDLNAATSSIEADGTQYCLTKNDEGKVGFAKVQAGLNIPTGKAYLVVKNNQTSNFFALDGSVTAIKNVNAAQNADGVYYTLQGVKVENPSKGIYIKNGKKVVIK